MPPGRAASVTDRVQGPWADHAVLRHLGNLLQPAYRMTGAVVDRGVEHQQSERGRQSIAGDLLPVVALVKCLRRIDGEIGDIQAGIRRGADAEPGSATCACIRSRHRSSCRGRRDWRCSRPRGPRRCRTCGRNCSCCQPGLSLSAIGAVVAASGKFRRQAVPRSPAMSQPGGFASDATLSHTALPVPMSAV